VYNHVVFVGGSKLFVAHWKWGRRRRLPFCEKEIHTPGMVRDIWTKFIMLIKKSFQTMSHMHYPTRCIALHVA